ncbi:hypothetical protein EYY60_11585 [Flavobacterium zhairuonense]|uniref:hypothetical protein n=1 Tax=Flavobacterium zhairuonense TaxID=2493631 RepID=UPI0010503483|nr:hypothetical protein [Flavobacterium zhairuonense]KAF2510147.1 hypothetical protein EYY60_11585 [Flavobacterium zhairuonense]
MTKENLNGRIHDKIIKSSELFLARESNQNVSLINALDWLNEIVDDENLNEVTEIYIYEEAFGDLNTKLKNTVVHAITSIIAFNYNNDNIAYLENLVIMDDGLKSDIAFDYLLKIGGYHEKFRDNIFLFIEKNFNDFSKNKLNILAFYLASIYPKESRVTSLLEFVVDFHKKKYPSTKSGSGSKNENEIQNNENKTARILEIETDEEKPWWKFW